MTRIPLGIPITLLATASACWSACAKPKAAAPKKEPVPEYSADIQARMLSFEDWKMHVESLSGETIELNGGRQENNHDKEGNELRDWEPNWNPVTQRDEHRIVSNPDDDENLWSAFIRLDGPRGVKAKWSIRIPPQLKVWHKSGNSWRELKSDKEYTTQLPLQMPVQIECIDHEEGKVALLMLTLNPKTPDIHIVAGFIPLKTEWIED